MTRKWHTVLTDKVEDHKNPANNNNKKMTIQVSHKSFIERVPVSRSLGVRRNGPSDLELRVPACGAPKGTSRRDAECPRREGVRGRRGRDGATAERRKVPAVDLDPKSRQGSEGPWV